MLFQTKCRVAVLALVAGLPFTSGAVTVYNEGTSGDLSNSGLSPTFVTVASGSNQIFGATGRDASGLDRDYLTISIPTGLQLTGITVLPGTTSGGAVSFIGLQAGSQVTLPTSATDAMGLLGWWHYGPSDINTNILPEIGVASNGSSGFTGPLGAGNYSFWIQDFNTGSFNYGFDLTLAAAPAPEPATYGLAMIGAGIAALSIFRRRHRGRAIK